MHIGGFRPSKTPTKFHERAPRERKKNENCGGRREKKKAKFWAVRRRVVRWRGVHREGGGGPAEGSIGNGVQGSGFRVQFRFWGRKQKQHRKVNFSYTPEPHIACCPIFVRHFELYPLNSILLFTSFLSNHQLFRCLNSFFFLEKVSQSNPILHFAFFYPPLLS